MNVKIKQKSATRFQVVVDHGLQTGRRCAACGRWSWVDDGVTGTACPRPRCNGALGDGAQHRREETHSGFTTEAQARKKRNELIGAGALGTYVPPAKTTLRAWADEWLARRKIDLKASTWSSYDATLRLHVIPRLGGAKLQAIAPGMIATLLTDLGGPDGLSSKSRHYVGIVLGQVLKDAADDGRIARNPMDKVKLPSGDAIAPPEMSWWTAEQSTAFITALDHDRLRPLVHLALDTGLRRGELCGLHWGDIDLDDGKLTVRRNRVVVKYAVVEGTPKTKASRRTIDIAPSTVAMLKAWAARQKSDRLAVGPEYALSDYVFTRPEGGPVHPGNMSQAFDRAIVRVNRERVAKETDALPRLRFHDLRHTHAVGLLIAGADLKTISGRLGHSSIMEMNRYLHLVPQLGREAAISAAVVL